VETVTSYLNLPSLNMQRKRPGPQEATKGVGAMDTIKNTPDYSRTTEASPVRRPLQEAAPAPGGLDHFFYRKLFHLKDNTRIMLRLLHEGDRQNLIDLFQKASAKDLWFFKHDLKNRSLLNFWLNHLDYRRLVPVVAVNLEDNQLIAAATLLRGKHTAQHIGEIKLFIAKPFRNLGLGSKILDELVHLARQERLYWLKAEVVADQSQLIKALRTKGFQIRAILEDFFVRKDGEAHDVLLLMLSLGEGKHEAF
jgi:RimJ/RimL family protein N-acetyltransferase